VTGLAVNVVGLAVSVTGLAANVTGLAVSMTGLAVEVVMMPICIRRLAFSSSRVMSFFLKRRSIARAIELIRF